MLNSAVCRLTCIVALLVALVSTGSALSLAKLGQRVRGSRAEWDIAEGVFGAAFFKNKQESHEDLLKIGYLIARQLVGGPIFSSSEDAQLKTRGKDETAASVTGIQYPDMPCKLAEYEVGRRNTVSFGLDFKDAESLSNDAKEVKGLVGQSHFGCLQHWHAMAPVSWVETNNGRQMVIFTTQEVQAMIVSTLVGLAREVSSALVTTKHLSQPASKESALHYAEFTMGRMLHTVADSWAPGHTVRALSDDGSPCGEILAFQGYDAQSHTEKGVFSGYENYHSYSDHVHALPSNGLQGVTGIESVRFACLASESARNDPRICDLYTCAASQTSSLLEIYHECSTLDEQACIKRFEAVLKDKVFKLRDGVGSNIAGGSAGAAKVEQKMKNKLATVVGATFKGECRKFLSHYTAGKAGKSEFVDKYLCGRPDATDLELFFKPGFDAKLKAVNFFPEVEGLDGTMQKLVGSLCPAIIE